jgi:hypothetical protein
MRCRPTYPIVANGGRYWLDLGALTVNDKRVWTASYDCATADYDHAVTADTIMAEALALLWLELQGE